MRRRRALALISALPLLVPTASRAAGQSVNVEHHEQAEVDRTRRLGTGLLWGGVGTSTAGCLVLFGLIPTSRNLRLADTQLEMCRVSIELDPVTFDCVAADDNVSRSRIARNAVVITGSLVIAGGLAVLGTGIWMRRKARRQQREHDKKYKPEWSVLPDVGPHRGCLRLHLRF